MKKFLIVFFLISVFILMASSLSIFAQTAPTAYLTANATTTITVAPGQTINYDWRSAGAVSAVSSYTIDAPDICPDNHGGTGPFSWIAGTAPGSASITIQPCQMGRTYTISYTVTSSSGQTHTAQIAVRVSLTGTPTASLTVNNSEEKTVAPGQSVTYVWSSTNTTAASSWYYIDSPDTCPNHAGGTGPFPWVANSTSGSLATTISPCQAGHTYTMTFSVGSSPAATAWDRVVVRVTGTIPISSATGSSVTTVSPISTTVGTIQTSATSQSSYASSLVNIVNNLIQTYRTIVGLPQRTTPTPTSSYIPVRSSPLPSPVVAPSGCTISSSCFDNSNPTESCDSLSYDTSTSTISSYGSQGRLLCPPESCHMVTRTICPEWEKADCSTTINEQYACLYEASQRMRADGSIDIAGLPVASAAEAAPQPANAESGSLWVAPAYRILDAGVGGQFISGYDVWCTYSDRELAVSECGASSVGSYCLPNWNPPGCINSPTPINQ